jgi:hypothetical protein
MVAMARTGASLDHRLVLPAVIGSTQPVCIFVIVLGVSGAGKSIANDVGSELVPYDLLARIADQVPIPTGEGMAELLMGEVPEDDPATGKTRLVRRQVLHNAYFYLDEGDSASAAGGRAGATFWPTVRSAWSGKTLGQQNAAKERQRAIPRGSYNFGMTFCYQEEHAGPVLDDVGGGTPQRLFFALARDPSIPDEPPPWPGPIDWIPANLGSQSGVALIDVAMPVVKEIRKRFLARQRGELLTDPLDSHADLMRLKLAAILGLWEKRWTVSEEDWALAGLLMAYHVAVRTYAIGKLRSRAAQKDEVTTNKAAYRQVVGKRAIERDDAEQHDQLVGKLVSRVIERPGITARELQQWVHAGPRFKDGLEGAIQTGAIEERAGRTLFPSTEPLSVV